LIVQAPVTNPSNFVIGASGVSLSGGIILEPGQSFIGLSSAAYFCIAPVTGNSLRFMEETA
jgi:hypothetical protein